MSPVVTAYFLAAVVSFEKYSAEERAILLLSLLVYFLGNSKSLLLVLQFLLLYSCSFCYAQERESKRFGKQSLLCLGSALGTFPI